MINNNFFILIGESGLIVWDYDAHRQYELSEKYATRLIEILYGNKGVDLQNSIDRDYVGLKVFSLSKRSVTPGWGWDILSRIFHQGTRNIPSDNTPDSEQAWAECYIAHCDEVWRRPSPYENHTRYKGKGISLKSIQAVTGLEEVLERRQTVRNFLDQAVDLEVVTKLLHYTLGFLASRRACENSGLPANLSYRRASPSGGGLNATEGYLYANNITGLERGIYYYDPYHHTLHLHEGALPELGSLLSGQHFANDLPMGIFLCSRFDKLWWKYPHSRAYRMAFIEVGHVAQTFQLAATDQGLQTWLTGAINEDRVDPLLRVASSPESVLFFVGAGHSCGSITPASLVNILIEPRT
ncbi:SagB family peptide dehydrogenase [Pseudomonas sp. BP8]|uniref:SagB family peptide dehydrogenase n=1 Tax=Pseudomonas sp. BP8 TaxID=2817864 RepID=UPI001AEBA1C6|nr:SagB family peptide dehydrogenase [Pseudomonas sp. BP8]MBP2262509.1 SagB-type dehydrogenase family enzyme [Pseudomonas sp. BP8]HDS1733704.1 SagB family peptide dehydrogenase [Pseudomonas putida]